MSPPPRVGVLSAQFLALCVLTFLTPAGSFDAKTPAQAKGEALLQELRGLGELQNSFVEFLGVDADGRFIVAHERDDEEDDEDGDSDDSYGRRRQVVFQIPSTHLHSHSSLMDRTLRHFLRSPEFEKHLAKQRIRPTPHFVWALFILYHRHARGKGHEEPLWQAWLDYHDEMRSGQDALMFWSRAELEVLEEGRMLETADGWMQNCDEAYEKLMEPISRFYPTFFPPSLIGPRQFRAAWGVALSQVVFLGPGRGTIGLDESAVNSTFLTPLPIRHAPLHGSVKAELVEMQRVGVDADGYEADLDEDAEVALNLVAVGGGGKGGGGKKLEAGDELVLHTSINGKHNDILIVEHGYVWDDLRATAVPIRMATHDWEYRPDRTARDRLLKVYNLKPRNDFYLRGGKEGKGGIPQKLLVWSRVMFSTKEEIAQLSVADDVHAALAAPLSLDTEQQVLTNLIQSLDGLRNEHDHSSDEDEYILEGRPNMSPRERIAVTHRRRVLMLIELHMELLNKLYEDVTEGERKKLIKSYGQYTTEKEKKVAEKNKVKKKRKAAKRPREPGLTHKGGWPEKAEL